MIDGQQIEQSPIHKQSTGGDNFNRNGRQFDLQQNLIQATQQCLTILAGTKELLVAIEVDKPYESFGGKSGHSIAS